MLDFFLVALLTLMWGGAFALIEIALPHFSPAMIAFLRIIGAAVFVCGFSLMKGHGLPRSKDHWLRCVALGALGFAMPFTLVPYGQEYVNSATAAVLMAISPIVTLILVHFFTPDERMTTRNLFGVALGFIGIVLLFADNLALGDLGIGVAALIAAALCYASSGLVMKGLRGYSDIASSAGALMAASILTIPALALRDDFNAISNTLKADATALLSVAALAVGPTGLAAILVLILVRRRGATFAATSNYGVPVVGVLVGAAVLGETIEWNILVTLFLILAAIWLTRSTRQAAS